MDDFEKDMDGYKPSSEELENLYIKMATLYGNDDDMIVKAAIYQTCLMNQLAAVHQVKHDEHILLIKTLLSLIAVILLIGGFVWIR